MWSGFWSIICPCHLACLEHPLALGALDACLLSVRQCPGSVCTCPASCLFALDEYPVPPRPPVCLVWRGFWHVSASRLCLGPTSIHDVLDSRGLALTPAGAVFVVFSWDSEHGLLFFSWVWSIVSLCLPSYSACCSSSPLRCVCVCVFRRTRMFNEFLLFFQDFIHSELFVLRFVSCLRFECNASHRSGAFNSVTSTLIRMHVCRTLSALS